MVTTKHHQTKLLRTRSDKIFDAVNMVFILLVLPVRLSHLLHDHRLLFRPKRGDHRRSAPVAGAGDAGFVSFSV